MYFRFDFIFQQIPLSVGTIFIASIVSLLNEIQSQCNWFKMPLSLNKFDLTEVLLFTVCLPMHIFDCMLWIALLSSVYFKANKNKNTIISTNSFYCISCFGRLFLYIESTRNVVNRKNQNAVSLKWFLWFLWF